jgi:hypothetical protein
MIDPDDIDEDVDGTGASSMYIPEGI